MVTLVIDAYDSFVYIIVQYLKQEKMGPIVRRNDTLSLGDIVAMAPDMILLGPGPGHPKDAGYVEIIDRFKNSIPIMGVCLGHQAIGLAFGSTVLRAKRPMHGKGSLIIHDGQGCFSGAPQGLSVIRYHSLIIDRDTLGDDLILTATSPADGCVMGVRHRHLPIEGVQFHPESIGTEFGSQFFRNFRDKYVAVHSLD